MWCIKLPHSSLGDTALTRQVLDQRHQKYEKHYQQPGLRKALEHIANPQTVELTQDANTWREAQMEAAPSPATHVCLTLWYVGIKNEKRFSEFLLYWRRKSYILK